MEIVSQLSEMQLLDAHGRPFRLGDAWRERTVVLLFVRHFG